MPGRLCSKHQDKGCGLHGAYPVWAALADDCPRGGFYRDKQPHPGNQHTEQPFGRGPDDMPAN